MKAKKTEAHTANRRAARISCLQYLLIFLNAWLLCGGCLLIHTSLLRKLENVDSVSGGLIITRSMLAYILLAAALLVCQLLIIRRYSLQRPVKILCESARRVAQGDYTVRIPPHRKDGKKDEFELLFEDFNAMTEELASTEMLKNDFVSNVSHELKTPLAVIQNYATILQNGDLSPSEQREYAARIAESTQHLATMITNILQLSRLENQKIVANRKPYNLSEQLARCILGFEQKWEEGMLDLDTELDDSIILNSDQNLLDIVWNNLLANAIKFTPEGGCVRVTASENAGQITVAVSDTGCGIPSDSLKHIFDKFYQADSSHATKGNGLGLAMVKRITEMLGGEIAVESAVQHGSTFTVTLPREPQ